MWNYCKNLQTHQRDKESPEADSLFDASVQWTRLDFPINGPGPYQYGKN